MDSMLERKRISEILDWVDNEADQIATGLREGLMTVDDACRYLDCIRLKVKGQEATDAESEQSEVDEAGRPDSKEPSTSPAPSDRSKFARYTVSPEDSAEIEEIRSATYAAALEDGSGYSPEDAMQLGPFADDEMAASYLVDHLHRCVDAVKAGLIKDVRDVGDIAASLRILARELALEPGEFDTDFVAFAGWGCDDDLLQALGVCQTADVDWLQIDERREADRQRSRAAAIRDRAIDWPVYHAAYESLSQVG